MAISVLVLLSGCSATIRDGTDSDSTAAGSGPVTHLADPDPGRASPIPEPVRPAIPGPPGIPPAPICRNPAFLDGPASPPPGAVRGEAGQDLVALTDRNPAGATFWLAPGTHPFTTSLVPKDGDIYLGGPGAVVDGQGSQNIAFWEEHFGRKAKDVRLAYLTIQNFTSEENQGAVYAGTGWRIDHSTFRENGFVALFAGTRNVIEFNCFESNGQLGIGTFNFSGAAQDLVVDHNEFRLNNTRGLKGCGCAGGMKWWATRGGRFTNNWVHHNNGAGVWADTNNIDILFDGNYIDDNANEGIFYEISYNFMISNNTLIRNALRKGAEANGNFPMAAIYISESRGVPESGYPYGRSEIHHNYLADNWDGVALWESGNRYAGTDGADYAPAFGDRLHWRTQNIDVHHNEFRMNKAAVNCSGNPNCGRNGLFSDWVDVPGSQRSPNTSHNQYQIAVSFNQDNEFHDNAYFGDWAFVGYDHQLLYDWNTWRARRPEPVSSFDYASPAPFGFGQDAESSMTR